MQAHSRAFAEIDVCSRCGGAFLDAGEGVMVHGTAAEPEMLASDGKAVATGQGTLQCPAGHAGAPSMETWEVRRGEDRVEIDWCRTCGGFFLDAGEGDALLELAERTERVIRSRDGAAFAAPRRARRWTSWTPTVRRRGARSSARWRAASSRRARATVATGGGTATTA